MHLTPDQLTQRLNTLPRVTLGAWPTPLDIDAVAGRHLQLSNPLLIKRDDLSGLYFGGNKTRQLEYTLADAKQRGADTVLMGIGAQSNHARQMAAAARRLGMKPIAVMPRSAQTENAEPFGNFLLTQLAGDIRWVDVDDYESGMTLAVTQVADEVAAAGGKPYQLTVPEMGPLCAVAMARGFLEFHQQTQKQAITPGTLFVSSAGPTAAGLAWANKALNAGWRIIAVAPIIWTTFTPDDYIVSAAAAIDAMLDTKVNVTTDDFTCRTDFIEGGYQQSTPALRRFVADFIRNTGLAIDLAYVGKTLFALNALRDELKHSTCLWHTGGLPAIMHHSLWKDV